MSHWRIPPALVVIDTALGDLRRIERGGTAKDYRVTHTAACAAGFSTSPEVIEQFRANPPDRFSTRHDFVSVDLTPCA